MTTSNIHGLFRGVFEVFGEGGKLLVEDFLNHVLSLQLYDPRIDSEFFGTLEKQLARTTYVSYASLFSLEVIKSKFISG